MDLLRKLEERTSLKSDVLLVSETSTLSAFQFNEGVTEIAATLTGRHAKKGQRIAVIGQDAREILPPLFAAWTLGMIPAIVSSDSDLATLLSMFDPQWTVDTAGILERKPTSSKALIPSTELVLFTSGPKGIPLGACLEREGLGQNAAATGKVLGLRAGDRFLVNAPLSSQSALFHFFSCLVSGAALVTTRGGQYGDDLIQVINLQRCTGFSGSPVYLSRAIQTTRREISPAFRSWVVSGDSLAGADLQKAREKFPGVTFYPTYGLTEVSGKLCFLDPREQARRPGSVGKAIGDFEITIRTPQGSAQALESGEIVARGPSLFLGYLGETSIRTEFATGDIGYQDADGFLWLEGRRDDIIKSGGEKISLMKIQEAILDLGVFSEASVVAIEDPFLGKAPCAFIIPKKGSVFNRRAAVASLRALLPLNHIPKRWVVTDELPTVSAPGLHRIRIRPKEIVS